MASLEPFIIKINEFIRNSFASCISEILNSPKPSEMDVFENAVGRLGILLHSTCIDIKQISKFLFRKQVGPKDIAIGQLFLQSFYNYQENLFNNPEMKCNFGREYIQGHSIEYRVELLKKYMRHMMSQYSATALIQGEMLAQFMNFQGNSGGSLLMQKAASTGKPVIVNRSIKFASEVVPLQIKKEILNVQLERFKECTFFDQIPQRIPNPDLRVIETLLELEMANVLSHTIIINKIERRRKQQAFPFLN